MDLSLCPRPESWKTKPGYRRYRGPVLASESALWSLPSVAISSSISFKRFRSDAFIAPYSREKGSLTPGNSPLGSAVSRSPFDVCWEGDTVTRRHDQTIAGAVPGAREVRGVCAVNTAWYRLQSSHCSDQRSNCGCRRHCHGAPERDASRADEWRSASGVGSNCAEGGKAN